MKSATLDNLPESVTEVVRNRIYAVGGSVSAELPLTWSPSEPGFLPIQCYLFLDGEDELLIDTGVAVHRDEIIAGVAALVRGSPPPRLTMTRWEPDAIINLPSLVEKFGIKSVLWSGTLNPLDFFDSIERASTDAHLEATTGVAMLREPPGSILKVGELELEIIRSNIAVLPSYWFYESKTRTLLTSDSFGFLKRSDRGGPNRGVDAQSEITTDRIERFLKTKFDWMIGIDTTPLIEELQGLFRDRPVDRICPALGCMIEGSDAVTLAVDRTIEALKLLAVEDRRSALGDFDFTKVRRLKAGGR